MRIELFCYSLLYCTRIRLLSLAYHLRPTISLQQHAFSSMHMYWPECILIRRIIRLNLQLLLDKLHMPCLSSRDEYYNSMLMIMLSYIGIVTYFSFTFSIVHPKQRLWIAFMYSCWAKAIDKIQNTHRPKYMQTEMNETQNNKRRHIAIANSWKKNTRFLEMEAEIIAAHLSLLVGRWGCTSPHQWSSGFLHEGYGRWGPTPAPLLSCNASAAQDNEWSPVPAEQWAVVWSWARM